MPRVKPSPDALIAWLKILCNLDLFIAAIAMVVLTLVTAAGVFMRYIAKNPILWQEEVGWKGYCEDSIGEYMNWFRESMINTRASCASRWRANIHHDAKDPTSFLPAGIWREQGST